MSLFSDTKEVHIGFTGTQKGMTELQFTSLHDATHSFRRKGHAIIGHHGDCIGADKQFHEYLDMRGWCSRIIIHPPDNDSKRAFCSSDKALLRSPKPYLTRNKDIVNESQFMIATPAEFEEQLRSGTWSTIRYAKKQGVDGIVIFPDGHTRHFWVLKDQF